MAIWLRILVVLLLASFASGSYAQTTAATTMAFQMPSAAMDMDTPAPCDHCKPGIIQHAGSCDALCLAAVILPSAISTEARIAASVRLEVRRIWGYEGEPLSPIPPPPRTIILG
jgi:hypothetical protein